MNLTDYQNKRKQQTTPIVPASNTKAAAIEVSDEDDDGWGDDWGATAKDKVDAQFDYANTNLNKLTDA